MSCPDGTVLIPSHCRRVSSKYDRLLRRLEAEEEELFDRRKVLEPLIRAYHRKLTPVPPSKRSLKPRLPQHDPRFWMRVPLILEEISLTETKFSGTKTPWKKRWDVLRQHIPPEYEPITALFEYWTINNTLRALQQSRNQLISKL
jgi:hypothetical protein